MKKALVGGVLLAGATNALPALEDDLWGNERTFEVSQADSTASRSRPTLKKSRGATVRRQGRGKHQPFEMYRKVELAEQERGGASAQLNARR